MNFNSRLVEVLRATLLDVEQNSGLAPDDPALSKLREILLLRIANLEAERMIEEAESKERTESATPSEASPAPTAQAETLESDG